jgi:hypothetical protein
LESKVQVCLPNNFPQNFSLIGAVGMCIVLYVFAAVEYKQPPRLPDWRVTKVSKLYRKARPSARKFHEYFLRRLHLCPSAFVPTHFFSGCCSDEQVTAEAAQPNYNSISVAKSIQAKAVRGPKKISEAVGGRAGRRKTTGGRSKKPADSNIYSTSKISRFPETVVTEECTGGSARQETLSYDAGGKLRKSAKSGGGRSKKALQGTRSKSTPSRRLIQIESGDYDNPTAPRADDEKGMDATSSRRSLMEARSRKYIDPRSISNRRPGYNISVTANGEGTSTSSKGVFADESPDERGLTALSYGFWSSMEVDTRSFKRNAAAVRVDPRILQPLHQKQVDEIFEVRGQQEAEGVVNDEDSWYAGMGSQAEMVLPPRPDIDGLFDNRNVLPSISKTHTVTASKQQKVLDNMGQQPVAIPARCPAAITGHTEQQQEATPPQHGFSKLSTILGGAKWKLAALGAFSTRPLHKVPGQ